MKFSFRSPRIVRLAVLFALAGPLIPGCSRPAAVHATVAAQTDRPANPPNKVLIAASDPLTPEAQLATFTLPPGFEIQLVAAEPAIQKPMQLAFDEKGRLLVSGSRDYPLGPPPGEAPSDSVLLLEIDGESGAATKITTFSSGYSICSGVEALPGGRAILGHAPDILLLSDTDGDGTADKKEVLYTGFARTDTHELPNSFTWGLDGWLYALQGHVNESDVKNKAGEVTPIHHGNVFRMRPDGAKIEVWARGMSNPWGLAFDREQNLFGADCESRPIWQIVEGLPYQGFLQDEEPLGFAPYITEDPHGASGFAGLVSYTARAFPEEYRDCLYMGSPITGIIYRDRPEGAGSTKHLTALPDFLSSSDPWFRPVDIELGPDGALYIADWYNRIIAHVEVPLDHPDRDKERGRIWRIVYRGGGTPGEDPGAIAAQFKGPMARDWSTANRRTLIAALGDDNAWIRRQAAAQLFHRFPDSLETHARRHLGRTHAGEVARLEAWALLERAGALSASEMAESAGDDSALIRAKAARALAHSASGESEASKTRDVLLALLDDPSATVAREAAMALRRIPGENSLRGLAARLDPSDSSDSSDTLLAYAIGFSFREHLKHDALLETAGREGALDGPRIKFLVATPTQRAAALQSEWLARGTIPPEYHPSALKNILNHGGEDGVRATFRPEAAVEPGASPPLVEYARAVFGGPVRRIDGLDAEALYAAWFPRLAEIPDAEAWHFALDMAARYRSKEGLPLARRALTDPAADLAARKNAAQLLLSLDYDAGAPQVLDRVAAADETPAFRRAAAYELGARANTPARFEALLAAMAGAPAEVQQVAVESLARQKPGVNYLLDAVERGDLHPGYLNHVLVRIFIDDIHKDPELTARQRRLVAPVESEESAANTQIARFRAAYESRASHDTTRGQVLVEENCLLCHRIGGIGAQRAPNLDGIGNRGIDRLLQDILQPNKEIDPAFRSTLITLKDGRTEEGFVTEEDDAWVVLLDGTGWESEIRKEDIRERVRLWVSPMPPDFGHVLPENDFLDIVAFLLDPPRTISPMTEQWKTAGP